MESLLVIDDEPSVRRAVQEVMQTSRLRVLTAQNSAQAVELFRQQRPLLVLLDIRLGFESGLDVFARLRELDPAALVVFMTGHGTSDTAIETIKRGAFDYLVK
ncbi:MAG: response regulator, partial [Aureliella sp.]